MGENYVVLAGAEMEVDLLRVSANVTTRAAAYGPEVLPLSDCVAVLEN
jgi:hypothetical protein